MENIKCRLRPRHRISRNADQLHFWAHGYELIVSRLRLPGGQWVVMGVADYSGAIGLTACSAVKEWMRKWTT